MVLIEVNSSERKKPPTRSTRKISPSGVAGVNTPQAARNTALTTPTTVSTGRKPNVPMIRAASVFMPSAPTAVAKVTSPVPKAESWPKPTKLRLPFDVVPPV